MSNTLRRRVAAVEADIRALKEAVEALVVQQVPADAASEEEQEEVGELDAQDALQTRYGETVAGKLYDAGYVTVDAVEEASDDELLAVDGIGAATLEKIREAN